MILIKNARLVDKNTDSKGAVLINGKKIIKIMSNAQAKELEKSSKKIEIFDAQGLILMPSFIDMHVHFRDPGLTQKEDIESGCMAAAAGGYGTVVCMPNTNPVISSQKMAEENNAKAKNRGLCTIIQAVSITKDFDGKTISHLKELNQKIVPLITEDGHEVEDSAVMFKGMSIAAEKKIIVSCHCEDPFLAQAAKPLRKKALDLMSSKNKENKNQAVEYLKNANELLAMAEDTATYRNIRLAKTAACHLHLCHVSTKNCIEQIKLAKKTGQNISCEITPHHIALNGSKSPEIFNIVNPPLRNEEDRLSLIKALADGTADVIATDHAPHTMEDKAAGAPGFSGIETAFAVCNTNLVKTKIINMKKLSSLMSARPAELLGLKKCGLIKEGFDADLVLVDSQKIWKVEGKNFKSKGKFTPLEGKKITGKVTATFHQGKLVYQGE